MTLVGLDLNAGRIRAVHGSLGDFPSTLPLERNAAALPLSLSLEQARLEIGSAAERSRRRMPHVCCHTFLPHLGEARRWKQGKHDLDSTQAVQAVWRRVEESLGAEPAVVTMPGYLSRWQADQVRFLASRVGVKLLGSIPSPLAAAVAAHAEGHWGESALVVDIDDHALSLAWVQGVGHEARLSEYRAFQHLGGHVWRERLINAVADGCVMQSRRDPRDSADAEQHIYEQVGLLLDAAAKSRVAQLSVQAPTWFQNLLISPEEIGGFCRNLVQQTLREVQRMLSGPGDHHPRAILLTHDAARLPGLSRAISKQLESIPGAVHSTPRPPSDDDFGINLLQDSGEDRCQLISLSRDALAQAAFLLVGAFQRGGLGPGHLEAAVSLPLPWPAEAGPPRITCQGETYILDGSTFLVGTQSGCHLHIDADRYPAVAARHCEIYFDHRTYVLFNRNRDGTYINDHVVSGSSVLQPGDCVRLGPGGPAFRFLGHPAPDIRGVSNPTR